MHGNISTSVNGVDIDLPLLSLKYRHPKCSRDGDIQGHSEKCGNGIQCSRVTEEHKEMTNIDIYH
jgi:hypothetical protein